MKPIPNKKKSVQSHGMNFEFFKEDRGRTQTTFLSFLTTYPPSLTFFTLSKYSRVHISSDTAFFKTLKKPSIVHRQK
jgi:hypothetical protein